MVELGLLGPLRVTVGGEDVPITSGRQRAVLARLALGAGEPISADRLLADVWGDDLPETGAKAVAHHVSRLRGLLDDGSRSMTLIRTSPAGYSLDVEPDAVDTHRFDRLVDDAKALLHDDVVAAERLTVEALGLWRGRPLADVEGTVSFDAEVRRLEQRRLLAVRTQVEARIAQGRDAEVIPILEKLVGEQPLDEAWVLLLMTALASAGRTADALRAFGDLRRRLATELGIDPSGDLRELERRLLDGAGTTGSRPQHDGPGSAPTPSRARAAPAMLTELVGRADVVDEIADAVGRSRLVTICGFGGIGKTRVAVEVATHVMDRFDETWFVDLTAIGEPAALPEAFIDAGGMSRDLRVEPARQLASHLTDRAVLLVVDNCEPLIADVARLVADVLGAGGQVHVLATSRIPLGLVGEHLHHLEPLDVRAGIEMLVDRARLVVPQLVIDRDGDDVARVAGLLDGVPLAIELAAARLKVMSLVAVADHLGDRFRLLTRGAGRDADRHRSLESVLDWSYEMLDPGDRALLRHVAACVDGFDLDAAVAIHTALRPDASELDVLDGLVRLTDASLVLYSAEADRYRMVETVRQYAVRRRSDDEAFAVPAAHARHYAAVVEPVAELWIRDHDSLVALGDADVGNIRAALEWTLDGGDPRLGLTICLRARQYFWWRTMARENLRWELRALDVNDEDAPGAMFVVGNALVDAHNVDDEEVEADLLRRADRALEWVDDAATRGRLLSAAAGAREYVDPRRSERQELEAYEVAERSDHALLRVLNNLAEHSWVSGRLRVDRPLRDHLETLAAADPTNPAILRIQATMAAREGRWADVDEIAGRLPRRADWGGVSLGLLRAEALGALGRHDDALAELAHVEHDRDVFRGSDGALVHSAIDLARSAPRDALRRLQRIGGPSLGRTGHNRATGMHVTVLMGVAAHQLGDDEHAAVYFGYAAAEQDQLDIVPRASVRPILEEATAACRRALGDRFQDLSARGARSEWADLPDVVVPE